MKLFLAVLIFSLSVQAVTISTITCTSNVATVTVANALVASQGFEITGSSVSTYNINGTAVTANSTSFTFNINCNGSATGGTFIPAPEILVLQITAANGTLQATDLFWNTVITPLPCLNCTSLWPTITAAQLAAIQTGTTIESSHVYTLPVNTTTAALNTFVLAQFTGIQSAYALNLPSFIGYCYNGTTWSAVCN
jgi:hypothetical protein